MLQLRFFEHAPINRTLHRRRLLFSLKRLNYGLTRLRKVSTQQHTLPLRSPRVDMHNTFDRGTISGFEVRTLGVSQGNQGNLHVLIKGNAK